MLYFRLHKPRSLKRGVKIQTCYKILLKDPHLNQNMTLFILSILFEVYCVVSFRKGSNFKLKIFKNKLLMYPNEINTFFN